jgi:4-alpha-glucanotransferase
VTPAPRPRLRALAARAGILPAYVDNDGRRRLASDATRERLLAAMGHDASSESAAERSLRALAARSTAELLEPVRVVDAGTRELRARIAARAKWSLELDLEDGSTAVAEGRGPRLRLPGAPGEGWHTLRLEVGGRVAAQRLVVTPRRALGVRERLGRPRGFGLWTHLYALRSERDWGAGDLGELAQLVDFAGRAGACFVGINPLHALWNRGADVCPYAPVSRLYRNPLYLEIEAVPELADCAEARKRLAALRPRIEALRSAPRVDHAGVADAKREVLQPLHRALRRPREYAAYREREGRALDDFATFLALAERHGHDWRAWPAALRDARSPEVVRFARDHAREIDFHRFVQFELDRQLAACADRARRAGLAFGVFGDLAIGTAPGGADTWMFRGAFALGASVGAPPDAFAPRGQDWSTPPPDPAQLRADGYATFARLLRGALAHTGALRVDHAMGMARLWWIPAGRPADEGAYVRYPVDDLLGILALESRRAGALLVAEDLGTVPPGFAGRLARRGILSSRVLYFESRPASRWSSRALVTANTHDLPPLAGFYAGRDLELRRALGEIESDAELANAKRERAAAGQALARRLGMKRLPGPPRLAAATTGFLCRTPAPLVGLSLDDLVGESEPLNLPGVPADRHPSWTRRIRVPLESLASDLGVKAALAAVPASRKPRR